MIDKNVVRNLVEEWLKDKEYFLVDVEISADDKIVVEIDHADGVWIEDCVQLSRYIEDHLSRDEEDYEFEVGSAGLGQPFKVPQQYENYVGKEVEVLDAAGKKAPRHAESRRRPPVHRYRKGKGEEGRLETARDGGRGQDILDG